MRKGPAPGTNLKRLTQEVADKICEAVRVGNYLNVSAAYAGVHIRTFEDWCRKGRAPDPAPAYRRFVEQLDHALAQSEVRDMALIGQAAQKHWQAAAWRLERRFPDRYALRNRLELEHSGGMTLGLLDLSRLSVDELEQLRSLHAKGMPEGAPIERPGLKAITQAAAD